MNTDTKNFQKIGNWIQQYIKRIIYHESYSRDARMVQYLQNNWYDTTLKKKIKYKNHVTISIDAEKAFHKIQHPFMIKTLYA